VRLITLRLVWKAMPRLLSPYTIIDFLVFIGASLSKPHMDEFVANFPYISGVHHAINHFRPLFCGFLLHSFTNCSHAERVEDVLKT